MPVPAAAAASERTPTASVRRALPALGTAGQGDTEYAHGGTGRAVAAGAGNRLGREIQSRYTDLWDEGTPDTASAGIGSELKTEKRNNCILQAQPSL